MPVKWLGVKTCAAKRPAHSLMHVVAWLLHMIVGLDGASAGATRSKNQRKHFEVVLGRIETVGQASEMSATVWDFDDLARERVRSVLRKSRLRAIK